MITINTISPTRFSFNGVTYHKNFMPFVTGNKIAIINVYDGCITLTDAPTIFSDYTVNGVTYSSVNDLQSALLDVIYTRNSLTNAAITLTTIGNSGAATLSGVTLNIPTYTLAGLGGQPLLTNPITGTGTTNFLPKFTGASTLGNSIIVESGDTIGIGTSSPQTYSNYSLLEINNTTGGGLRLKNSAGTGIFEVITNSSETYIKNIPALPMWFGTNNTERMRITSAGNVGIGTTSPNNRLSIVGGSIDIQDGTGKIGFNVNDTFTAYGGSIAHYGMSRAAGAEPVAISGYYGIGFFTDGSEKMRITTGGNVGIGTTSPTSSNWSRTLQLEGASAGFKVASSSANGEFWAAGDVGINVNTSGKNLYLGNASSLTAFTLASSGNVGINTTNPAQRLDVNGLINSTNGISVGGEGVSRFWTGTQAQYDAIGTKVSTTVYLIT
jgi:hypothetical protein